MPEWSARQLLRSPVPRPRPIRWDFLWLGYAADEDLRRVWPPRLRRKGRGLRVLGYVVSAVSVVGLAAWALATRQRALTGPLTGLFLLSVVALRAADQRRLFALPARRVARARLRTLRLAEPDLAKELERRRRFWHAALGSSRPNHLQTPELAAVFAGLITMIAAVDQILRAYLYSELHVVFYVGFALGPTALFARRLAKRDHQRLADLACMNCGYPLADVPTAWATAPGPPDAATDADAPQPVLERLGPPRCSECGCDWPLVPPEVTSRKFDEPAVPARRSSPR